MITCGILEKDSTQNSRKGSYAGFQKRITSVILEKDNTQDSRKG